MRTKKPNIKISNLFLSNVQDLIAALPTDEEKKDLDKAFESLIGFVSNLKEKVASLPTREDSEVIIESIVLINNYIKKAESIPALSTSLGLAGKRESKVFQKKTSDEDIQKAKKAINHLKTLPIDEIKIQLQSSKFLLSDLQLIADEIGIRYDKKLNKDSLSNQIAIKISNYRGYQHLSGQSD